MSTQRKKAGAVRKARASHSADPIDHVIVLMLENRSFDHALGSLQPVVPGLDGIPGARQRVNYDAGHNPYYQDLARTTRIGIDPPHETDSVLVQMSNKNGGFVQALEQAKPGSSVAERQDVMSFYPLGQLPALHALAQSFLICDRWFSSVPGPTWTNRLFAHSGTSLGRVKMPDGVFDSGWHWYDQDTIYDRLNERRIDWRIYHGDIPQSLLLVHQLLPRNARRYRRMGSLFEDLEGPAREFPRYVFIEPSYFGADQNDDHPPSDLLEGERLIARVYNALRASSLWQSSLLVILFDEHGGFYDHVEPPHAVAPDAHTEEYDFTRYGPRVPALLVSPYVAAGVTHATFDHTSLLRYVSDKWELAPLGKRVGSAASFAGSIGSELRTDTPARIEVPASVPAGARALRAIAAPELNGHHQALIAFSDFLASQTRDEPEGRERRTMAMRAAPLPETEAAIGRVERFLAQQRGPRARRTIARPT